MGVLEPRMVTVLTTDKCTAECRHCCMNSGPERERRLSYEQIERALGQLFEHYRIKVVVFAGGEPTLLGKDLLRSIAFCKRNAVATRVVTNAYWAHSAEAAATRCAELREAGLDELNISMDDYHEPYVAFERVKLACQAAMKLDFRTVAIANTYGPESVLSPDLLEREFGVGEAQLQRRYDVDGRNHTYERPADGKPLFVLSNSRVQRLGRGAELIDESELISESCLPHVDAIGGCPHAVQSAAISAGNHLVSCCGFELHGNPFLDFGDLGKHELADLVARADGDLIVNLIALVGPPRLMVLLQQLCPDQVSFPRKSYASYCQVCHDLVGIERNRRALLEHQGLFAELIIEARRALAEARGDGREMLVQMPRLRLVNPETGAVAEWPPPSKDAWDSPT